MTSKFLFELGTEEIPADMIEPALAQLCQAFQQLFDENQLPVAQLKAYSTPRRLAVLAEGLPDRCPDREEVTLGPPRSVAFDSEDQPTAAAQGFARKLDIAVEELEMTRTPRGEYLSARRKVQGAKVVDILTASLPDLIASISWPKSMYWTDSRFRFIRPIRWLVALWNHKVVPFQFEGVSSGRNTRGHRLLGSNDIAIDHPDQYVSLLEENFVLVDMSERQKRIKAGLAREAGHLKVVDDQTLLDTVVHLNEFPAVVRGDFNPEFLKIPGEVLVTVMRFHQKYFSLEDKEGRLAPSFLTVLNTAGDPEGNIRRGHEKVLQARLEDAAFFWHSDRKQRLAERLDSLSHILFQEKLGSYRDKTSRIEAICRQMSGNPSLLEAARLCKTDLTTEMVREFPELQGVMGGLYAREEGYPEEVWNAIYDQYRPVSLDDKLPTTQLGALLSIADRIDTIVGCFGIGIVPSGSSDPFALRRQAQGLVTLLLRNRLEISLETLVRAAQENFPETDQAQSGYEEMLEFLRQRLSFVLHREGIPPDVRKAVFAVGLSSVPDAEQRARALNRIKDDKDFEALAVAYKRIKNILGKYGEAVPEVDPKRFVEEGEEALFKAYEECRPRVELAVEAGKYLDALREIAGIRRAVDQFFDAVLVMAEETELRRNRIALLGAISELFLSIADVSEIVRKEGEVNGG